MAPPWVAERETTPAEAARRIARQFPALAPVYARPFGAGWDNTALLVNDRFVFRFPRRQVAVALVETEARILPALAPTLPLPIPNPNFFGVPDKDSPWPFLGYPRLSGRTACIARLSVLDREELAAPLGGFLRALHAFPIDLARDRGAPPDHLRRLDLSYRLPWARERLARAQAKGLLDRPEPLAQLLEDAPTVAARADTLVHGDLWIRHLLVQGDNRVCGVIDWGDLHCGDPAADLMAAHLLLPSSAHDAFRAAYGAVDAAIWRLARTRALWHTLAVRLWADEIGDEDLLRETDLSLGYLAETLT